MKFLVNFYPLWQVSIVAHEDITFLSWDHKVLRKLLKKERFLQNVFDSLIGKDVTKKLLLVTKNVTEAQPGFAPFRAGSILYLHHEIVEAGRAVSREGSFFFLSLIDHKIIICLCSFHF